MTTLHRLQYWLLAVIVFLAAVVAMTWKATEAMKSDLASAESTADIRAAYSDTLFVAGAGVDQSLWAEVMANRDRITRLERKVNVAYSSRDSLKRHLRQVDEALAAQARAIQRLR